VWQKGPGHGPRGRFPTGEHRSSLQTQMQPKQATTHGSGMQCSARRWVEWEPGRQRVRVMRGGGERARLEHNLQCRREHCITSRMQWQINQESQSVFVTCLATQLHFTRSALLGSSSTAEIPARLYRSHVRCRSCSGRRKHWSKDFAKDRQQSYTLLCACL